MFPLAPRGGRHTGPPEAPHGRGGRSTSRRKEHTEVGGAPLWTGDVTPLTLPAPASGCPVSMHRRLHTHQHEQPRQQPTYRSMSEWRVGEWDHKANM